MIVFCTTCKGRVQHIERTLPQNLADNAGYADCKFVLLNYNSPDNLLAYVMTNHRDAVDSGRLVIYSYTDKVPFQMAHAKNMAHRLGILEGGDILVNLDADNFTGYGFAAYVAEQFKQSDVYLWSKMIQDGPNRLVRGISGRIAVSSRAFLNAGGYDEKYNTYSPDDKDFSARLKRMGYTPHEIDRRFLGAIHHGPQLRFKEYQHVSDLSSYDEFELVNKSTNTVVNFGHVGEGTVYKNFDATPTVLGPIPTRIFGIGMQKTATSSLNKALKILEIDSSHWGSAGKAKKIWREMMASGKSYTVEQHYATSDLPVSLLYQQLDKAYPGSKFILTTRNEKDWLRSVENHWNPRLNPYRESWDTDCFTHKIHTELYGRSTFNADVFLDRYRKHNAGVLDYFKGRPADLLVMNMDCAGTHGWSELCPFLGEQVPSVPYPHEFATPRQSQPSLCRRLWNWLLKWDWL